MIWKKAVLIKSLEDIHLGGRVDSEAAQGCPNRPIENVHMNRKQHSDMQYGKWEANTWGKPHSEGET